MAWSGTACKRPSTSSLITRIGRTSSLHLRKDNECKGCGEWRKAMDGLDSLHCL